MSAETLNTNVNAGIHPLARKNVERIFSDIEKEIVKSFENQWYVTKADFIKTGASEYRQPLKIHFYLYNFRFNAKIE